MKLYLFVHWARDVNQMNLIDLEAVQWWWLLANVQATMSKTILDISQLWARGMVVSHAYVRLENKMAAPIDVLVLWARSSEPICRDGPISKWLLQSMY